MFVWNLVILFVVGVYSHSGLLFATSLSIPVTNNIRLQAAPLIGGPSWLPVHVKVLVGETNSFDFVPLDATSPTTLRKLISLRRVPAEARVKTATTDCDQDLQTRRALEFCDAYSKDLHLISNNCWTFAYELIDFILRENDLSS